MFETEIESDELILVRIAAQQKDYYFKKFLIKLSSLDLIADILLSCFLLSNWKNPLLVKLYTLGFNEMSDIFLIRNVMTHPMWRRKAAGRL